MSGEQAFSAGELSGMKTAQEGHMMDSCRILVWAAGSADAYGRKVDSYTAGSEIACGFKFDNRTVEVQGESEVVVIDGRFRLPAATTIKASDRIRLTKRFGTALSPAVDFDVIGQPRLGPSGLVVDVAKVTF